MNNYLIRHTNAHTTSTTIPFSQNLINLFLNVFTAFLILPPTAIGIYQAGFHISGFLCDLYR